MEENISSMRAFFITAIIQNNNPKYKGRHRKSTLPASLGLKILEINPRKVL
jgi:hypothetical protein